MYYTLSLILFLLGHVCGKSLGRESTNDNFDKLIDLEYWLTLDPVSLKNEIYNTIDALEDMSYYEMYSLRTNDKFSMNIHLFGEQIWQSIKQFFIAIGLMDANDNGTRESTKFIRGYTDVDHKSPSIYFTIISQLLSYLLFLPITGRINEKINGHLETYNYQKRGYVKSTYNLSDHLTEDSQYGIALIDALEKLNGFVGAFSSCWNSRDEFKDIKYSFGKLIKNPPSVMKQIVISRLKKAIPNSPSKRGASYSESEAITCQLLTTDKNKFNSCLIQMQSMKSCIKMHLNNYNLRNKRQLLLKRLNRLKTSIDDLQTSCGMERINTHFSLFCKNNKRSDENSYSNIANLFLKSSDNLFINFQGSKNVTNYLLRFISRNSLASDIFREISILNNIYRQSTARKNQLHEISIRYKLANDSYVQISNDLKEFENNMKNMVINAINQLHQITIQIQKLLADSASSAVGIDLSDTLKTSIFIYESMKKILDTVEKSKTFSVKSKLIGDGKSNASIRKSDMKKPIENIIITLKRSNQLNVIKKSSSIVTLANTFLLATVFYECISLLAVVMYGGNKKVIPNTPQVDHDHGNFDELTEFNHAEDYDTYEESTEMYYRKKN